VSVVEAGRFMGEYGEKRGEGQPFDSPDEKHRDSLRMTSSVQQDQ